MKHYNYQYIKYLYSFSLQMGQGLIVYHEKPKIDSTSLKTKMDEESVRFRKGQWQQHQMHQLYVNIKEWKIKSLNLCRNRHKEILKEISSIKFSNLSYLNVGQNNIESIQCLSWLKLPKLVELHLRQNMICDISIIRRLKLSKLEVLNLNSNFIREGKEIPLLQEKLKTITIEFGSHNSQQISEIRWFAKLVSLHKIRISSDERIDQLAFQRALVRKFQDIGLNQP